MKHFDIIAFAHREKVTHWCKIWANFGLNFTQCVNDISSTICAYCVWAYSVERACEVLDPIRENFNLYAFTMLGWQGTLFFPIP